MVYTLESIRSRDPRHLVSEIDSKRILDRFEIVWLKPVEPMLLHCITEPQSMFTTTSVVDIRTQENGNLVVTTRQSIFVFKGEKQA